MIKVSAQTFSTTSRKKSEINVRPCDNLHTALRFYKSNDTVRTTQEYSLRISEFNYISQSYHFSLSNITAQKQSPGSGLLKSVLRNLAKFTGKHLCRSLSP